MMTVKEFFNLSFDLDFVGNLWFLALRLLFFFILYYIIIYLFKIVLKKKKINHKLNISILIMSIGSLLFVWFYIINHYTAQFDIQNESINQIELCWDDCVTIELTEEEQDTLTHALNDYHFAYDEEFFLIDWNSNAKSVKVTINEQELYYLHVDFMGVEVFTLGFKQDDAFFTRSGSNPITKILDQYMIEHADILDQE